MRCPECGYENVEGIERCIRCGASLNGAMRIGPYELRGELGRGAMARVWLAWDPMLERSVAIKEPMFDTRLSKDVLDEMGRRFVQEGRTAARLNHPNIVTIYAADVYDNRPAIVMELLDGVTLTGLLKRGPLTPSEALRVLDQLLDAVGYAHAHGVIHRDIKPDNIFVSPEGTVKLADFGIAHVDDGVRTRATVDGAILGTPGYMSPEQAVGGAIDTRSDLFAIGVVAYEMLTAQNPFGADEGTDPIAVLLRIAHEPTPDTSQLPSALRPAITAALSKDPAERPQDAAAFKALLHGSPSGATVERAKTLRGEGPAVAPGRTPRQASRSVLPYLFVFIVGLAALFALFISARPNPAGIVSAPTEVEETPTSFYLCSTEDGYLALFEGEIGDDTDPAQVTDLLVSELDEETASQLEAGIVFATREEAEDEIERYRQQIEESHQEAEEETQPVTPDETDDQETSGNGLSAATLGRTWVGTFDGYSQYADNGIVKRTITIVFDTVNEDGSVGGDCYVGTADSEGLYQQGSYRVTGTIDWETGVVLLYGTEWIDQGDLVGMRRFEGTIGETLDTLSGYSEELTEQHRRGGWEMTVA